MWTEAKNKLALKYENRVEGMSFVRVLTLGLGLVTCATISSFAQQCPLASNTGPSTASEVRTLEGKLIFHDGMRKWFELKLDSPQCGQPSIQIIGTERTRKQLQVLRGCRVRTKGALDFSPTGYYSLDICQVPHQVEPVGICEQQPPFPDDPKGTPDKSIRQYRVDMLVNSGPGDHPILFHVSSAGKELKPWQVYASYFLTGGFVLYGYCGKDFMVDRVFGAPEASPSHFGERGDPADAAMFDPEGVAESGKTTFRLGYTCIRQK